MRSIANPARHIEIQGECHPRFSLVKDAFYRNFTERGEVGAAVAVTLDGESVVDLWAGFKDAAQTRLWESETIVCVQSVSKEIVALAVHMAVDRGLLDVDAPVVKYWPEFGQHGKEDTKLRWLLDHRAGIPITDHATPGMAYDWNAMIESLARTVPLWKPGTMPCYHSANYGFPLGEVLRRVTGKSVGAFVREEIASPLNVPCFIGLTPDEEKNVATFLDQETHPSSAWSLEGENIFAKSWKIFWDDEDFNSVGWRRAEIPSVNCHTNARALAKICGLMSLGGELGGVRLLSQSTLEKAGEVQWTGVDVQNRNLSLSLGFLMPLPGARVTSRKSMGMAGAGGATAFADPENRIGFGYTMNSMDPSLAKPRPAALQAALISSLGQ
ncbi:MAG: beta-lactamase family protein [Polaromonas sp.]|uniref:serine hydrolase domain-containing protein n=1 Tax=Polaromonas sp. TaxID=1869339 RepID=UPI0025FEB529|nr:serine hydrolase domain-containing protein [Polaromonas sp.]MBI2726254.1 beta-lactamase family protein [Polaromonas sp.]